MEFLFIISPLFFGLVLFIVLKLKKDEMTNLAVSSVILSLFLWLLTFLIKSSYTDTLTKDYEYHGFYGARVEYYEEWSTYVHETCTKTETYNCGTDSKGNTQTCTETVTYDCSYCDENSAEYVLIDNIGNRYNISRSEYLAILKKWNKTPIFVELNRNITYYGRCGKDGDMFYAEYGGEVLASINITKKVPYVNKVKNLNTTYKFEDISDIEAKKLGLHDYPKVDGLYQSSFIGFKKFTFLHSSTDKIDYLNSHLGSSKKFRLYILAYYNKPISISVKQQSYWQNGNKNELVVCVGLDSNTNRINWVNIFSWSNNKMVEVATRNELLDIKYFNNHTIDQIYNVLYKNINLYWNKKSFKEFDYIDVPLPDSYYITLGVTTFVFNILFVFLFIYIIRDKKRWI